MNTTTTQEIDVPRKTTYTVLLLCWLAILSEGYDLGVMGTIIPALMKDDSWHLTPLQIGTMGSAALLGTLLGCYGFGILSDLVGRKRILITCVILFSLSMLAAALAPTPAMFSFIRLVGGLGLGGVISAAATLTVEYSPTRSKNINFALMYSGYSLGALVSALVGIALLQSHGWRIVVGLGLLPIVFVPLMMAWLPESIEFLLAKQRAVEAERLATRLGISFHAVLARRRSASSKVGVGDVLAALFGLQMASTTILIWLVEFVMILIVYGLGTWLPQIMRSAGYNLGSSLMFLAVFSLASAVGGVLLGRLSDRLGVRLTISVWFLIGAAAIAGLSVKSSMLATYSLVALAGVGTVAAALIFLGYIPRLYPAHARTTATGWAVGFGRFGAMAGPLVGGFITGLDVGPFWMFMVFSGAALIAGLGVLCIPRNPYSETDSGAVGHASGVQPAS